jgi:hypothetical protein
MLELHYDSDGELQGFDVPESLFEDLDTIPDWLSKDSPVRTMRDHDDRR